MIKLVALHFGANNKTLICLKETWKWIGRVVNRSLDFDFWFKNSLIYIFFKYWVNIISCFVVLSKRDICRHYLRMNDKTSNPDTWSLWKAQATCSELVNSGNSIESIKDFLESKGFSKMYKWLFSPQTILVLQN